MPTPATPEQIAAMEARGWEQIPIGHYSTSSYTHRRGFGIGWCNGETLTAKALAEALAELPEGATVVASSGEHGVGETPYEIFYDPDKNKAEIS